MKVLYDGKEIGNIVTNRSLSIPEALNLIGIDPNEEEGGDPKYDYSLFEIDYSSEYAAQLGRKGGAVKSERKAKSSAENGKLGGAPTLYERARHYVLGMEFTDEQMEFIFADWPEGNDHYRWLLSATKKEIEDWIEAGQ